MADTASENPKIKYSVRVQLGVLFAVVLIGLLALLNTYPMIVSRDLVFSSKESSLCNQSSVAASSLAALETLTEDGVSQVMTLLDVTDVSRVIVTDNDALVLYDSSRTDPAVGRYMLFSEISRALDGKEVFYSRYTGDAFLSHAATPIVSHGITLGAVYIYEYDTAQADLIVGIQRNLRNTSIIVGCIVMIAILIFTGLLTNRITGLLQAIRVVREGNYGYRINVTGSDEFSLLGQEFNTLTDRLQETDEVRRRFVSDASHELKTPLAAIRLLSDSIVQSENMDTATMREFVTDIGEESERLQRLTEKLLSLTRLDNNILNENYSVDVGHVAETTLHLLSPLASKKDIRLTYNLSTDCHILATDDDVYQIIFNIVENGIKYNLPGGTVSLDLYCQDNVVHLTVEDTGIGIPEEHLSNIFSRFYRVDKARSREAGGSGLGLSIVHDTVAAHGGSISVERVQPNGTRFEVTFPSFDGQEGLS